MKFKESAVRAPEPPKSPVWDTYRPWKSVGEDLATSLFDLGATQYSSEFQERIDAAGRQFLDELSHARDRTACAAHKPGDWTDPEAKYAQLWCEDSVALIKKYFHLLLNLSRKCRDELRTTPIEWTKAKIVEIIQHSFRFDERQSPPLMPTTFHWWCRMATGVLIMGNRDVRSSTPHESILVTHLASSFAMRFRYVLARLADEALLEEPITSRTGEVNPIGGSGATKARESIVRPLLEKKGWSTQDWANKSNVDFHTADNYLKHQTRPYPSTRQKLAGSLGLAIGDLPK